MTQYHSEPNRSAPHAVQLDKSEPHWIVYRDRRIHARVATMGEAAALIDRIRRIAGAGAGKLTVRTSAR